jgi:hypothetical protein
MNNKNEHYGYGFLDFCFKYLRTLFLNSLGKPLKNRKDLLLLLSILKLKGIGVEINNNPDSFSNAILNNSNLSLLYSIHSGFQEDDETSENTTKINNQFDLQNSLPTQTTIRGMDHHKTIQTSSEEASKLFKDQTIDFVYIDGDHTYKGCKSDISLWWPKVKIGGIISGYGYLDGPFDYFGVKSAVDEFTTKTNQKLFIIKQDWPSWYIIKNRHRKA